MGFLTLIARKPKPGFPKLPRTTRCLPIGRPKLVVAVRVVVSRRRPGDLGILFAYLVVFGE